MKNAKLQTMYKTIVLSIALVLSASAYANKGVEKSNQIHYNFSVNPNVHFDLNANNAVVDLQTWDKNEVDVDITVTVRAEDEEAASDFLNKAVPRVTEGFDLAEVDLSLCIKMWESTNRMSKVKFDDGGWIKIIDYKIKVDIKVPADSQLSIKNSYGKLTMSDFGGEIAITGYEGDIYGGDLTGKSTIKMTYGTMKFGEIKKMTKLDLYESTFEATAIPDCLVESHYSTVTVAETGNLVFASYEDYFDLGTTKKLEGKLTYSKLKAQSIGSSDLVVYQVEMNVGNSGNVKLDTKYGKYHFGTAGNITLVSSYEDQLHFDQMGSLQGEGKYTKLTCSHVNGDVIYNGYDGHVTLESIGDKTNVIDVDGKYLNVDMRINTSRAYKLNVDVQYAKIDYPAEDFSSSVSSDSDHTKFNLVPNNFGAGGLSVSFSGYEIEARIRH